MALLIRPQNIPNSTKVLLGCLVVVSSLIFFVKVGHLRATQAAGTGTVENFHDIKVPYLQLIPRYTIFYPWVLVVSIFSEITVFSFLLSAIVLTIASRYVEKFWGFKEVIKFVFVVGSLTNFATVLTTIISNILRGDVQGMDTPLGGGISYYFGFLVVLKQLIPEHNIVLFQGLLNFRVKHVPFIFLVLVLLTSLLITRSSYPVLPSLGSFIVSYNYLRFFQVFALDPLLPVASTGDTPSIVHGDASDAFKFVEFFPGFSKPVLGSVFDKVYEVSVFLGIVTPFNDDIIEQSNLRAQKRSEQINQTQKSVANTVAERRRQVALQVIEDRIKERT